MFLLVGGQITYSVYVGGDAWEHRGGSNRYISLAMPLFFTLFTLALEQLFAKISSGNEILKIKNLLFINLSNFISNKIL